MINKADRKYINNLIIHTEDSLKLLSNDEKKKRERMVCAAFLRCLGIRFSPADLESPQNDPPDVTFEEAHFEVRELLDYGRRRGDEYKERYKTLKMAKTVEDTFISIKSPIPISYKELFEIVTAALFDKADLYRQKGCSSLDALVYINQNRFLDPATSISTFDTLISQGWRSVSLFLPPYSHVIFAKDTAPEFLKSNKGQSKRKWDDPDTFFKLNEKDGK